MACSNCGQPIPDHCRHHRIPCCPGKCSRAREVLKAQHDSGLTLEQISNVHQITRDRVIRILYGDDQPRAGA